MINSIDKFKMCREFTIMINSDVFKNLLIYRVHQKKLNRFEIALNFAKQLLVSSFLYIYGLFRCL